MRTSSGLSMRRICACYRRSRRFSLIQGHGFRIRASASTIQSSCTASNISSFIARSLHRAKSTPPIALRRSSTRARGKALFSISRSSCAMPHHRSCCARSGRPCSCAATVVPGALARLRSLCRAALNVALERLDELKTPIGAALLYRLNGDRNPLHADPAAAARQGSIGRFCMVLCTYGVIGYLLVRTVCNHDPSRLLSLGARFSSPVFPGETIRLEAVRRSDEVYLPGDGTRAKRRRPESGLRARAAKARLAAQASRRIALHTYGSVLYGFKS